MKGGLEFDYDQPNLWVWFWQQYCKSHNQHTKGNLGFSALLKDMKTDGDSMFYVLRLDYSPLGFHLLTDS